MTEDTWGVFGGIRTLILSNITVVRYATWPLNDNEAGGDLDLIQTSMLLLCK